MDVQTHRFTVTEYAELAKLEVFQSGLRTELIDGQIVEMTPKNDDHSYRLSLLNRFFSKRLSDDYLVRVQDPVVLSEYTEPEPDLVIHRYRNRHPRPGEVLLLIEVAESSLAYDRGRKAGLYAQAGIPDYWIVNLVDSQLEVFRNPVDGRYTEIVSVTAGTVSPLLLPDIRLDIATVFPVDLED
jgi:Uma2 family endonuclease